MKHEKAEEDEAVDGEVVIVVGEDKMESDHDCKIKEARDARRKRILARSSERLAYITGEGKPTPLSSPCNPSPSLQLLDSSAAHEPRKSCASRSLGFTKEHESCNGTSGSVKATTCGEEGPRLMQKDRKTPQPLEDQSKVSKSCHTEGAGKSDSRDFGTAATGKHSEMAALSRKSLGAHDQITRYCVLANLSRSIRDSLVPRAVCAACVALLFMGISALTPPMHPWGGLIMNLYSVLAVVFAMDFLFVLRALVSCNNTPNEAGAIKAGDIAQASAYKKGMNWAVVMQIVLSFSLDCSVSASLLGGGLLLSRNLFSASCSAM